MTTSDSSSDDTFAELLRRISETPKGQEPRRAIRTGDLLAQRFRIMRELGRGGMGRVFAAYDEQNHAPVAVKMVGRLTPQAVVQLKREFRTASDVVHTHIVRLHELFRDGMEWFFTMELVRGVLLGELLDRTDTEKRPAIIRVVVQQLTAALDAVHAAGAVHADLKPSNFLVETSDPPRVVLLDFGLAQEFGASSGGGTRAYMAPEQFFGEEVAQYTDWYSLGVVLHEALTRKLPRPGSPSPELADAPADLQALCRALLELSPEKRPAATTILGMLGVDCSGKHNSSVPPRSRLVGRHEELHQFAQLRASATPSSPALVLVHGPSGIGKTALIEHLVGLERAHGALVLRGRCRENESIGYKAVDGVVDDLVTVLSEMSDAETRQVLPGALADLVQLFPALRGCSAVAQLAGDAVERDDQALVRQRAIAAFTELLRNLSALASLVVWIDDLQWSDAESALILGPALGGMTPVPLLFIGSYRTDRPEHIPLLHGLYADRSLHLSPPSELALGALTAADAQQMALALLPASIGDPAARARDIARDAAGLPLFITELAHVTRTAHPAPVSDSAPVTLSSVVASRVSALPATAQNVLELVALAGHPLQRAILKQAQRLRSTEFDDAIILLRATRLVQTTGPRDDHTVDMRHDRLRELVSRSIEGHRRKQHHLSLAAVLETRAGKPEEIATHYQNAGELARAATHWLAAAEDSAKALAFRKAAEFYDRALQRAPLEPAERQRVQRRRAEMLAYAGEGELAAQIYLEAADGAAPDEAIELRRRAAEQLLLSGRIQQGLKVMDRVLAATRMPRTRTGKGAIPSLLLGRLRVRLRGLSYRLRAEAEVSREELARLDVAWTMACSMGFVDYIRGADFQNRHLLLALRAGEPRRLGRALALEALNAAAPGPGSRQRTDLLLRVAESLVEEAADRDSALGLLSLARGVAAYLHSDTERAVVHCSEAVELLTTRCAGAVWERVTAQRFLVAALFHAGALARLCEVVPPLLSQAEVTANLYARQFFRSGYSIVAWLARDEPAEARRQLGLAAEEWRSESYQLPEYNRLLSHVFIELYTGNWSQAAATIREQWRSAEDAQLLRIAIVRTQLLQLRGATAIAAAREASDQGRRSAASDLRSDARRCASLLRRIPLRRATPMASLIDAAVQCAERAPAGAIVHLQSAGEAFDEQGMQLFAAAARLRLSALIGGSAGVAMAAAARRRFAAEHVLEPDKMADLLAPGFLA